jgi:lipopolysaccharide/colanic/teichoic acid biosynthesis glycosyltransferase
MSQVLLSSPIQTQPAAWPAPVAVPEQARTVLLIGDPFPEIDEAFELEGYTVLHPKTIHEARNLLIAQCLNHHQPSPDAVFCSTGMDEALVAHFAGYLSIVKELRDIPVILLDKQTRQNTSRQLPYNVDDIMLADAPVEDLIDKVAVLKKYKCLKNKYPYQPGMPRKAAIRPGRVLGRMVDILFASVCLILLSPVLLLVAIAIKLESKGSVLYASPRAGRGYRIFKFYKFRTMVKDADTKINDLRHLNQYDVKNNKGPVFIKINNDPRVTRLGRFLRNTSIDELPQLINVLLGDMSLVGNRPLPLYEACSLTIDQAAQRFLAPAGITGLWQIKKRGQPNMSVQERINLDIDYANQRSFFYDMRILLNTPKVLMQKADV